MMKINQPLVYLIIVLISISFFSCKDSKKKNEEKSIEESNETIDVSEAANDETNPAQWIYDHNADIPVKSTEILDIGITPEELIDFLNTQNENVKLEFSKHSGDTLFVKIKESTFLTQRMGTTGADAYMSVATYTLTEAENVNYVHFDFEEGDHAIPGTYSRKYYIDRNKERFQ